MKHTQESRIITALEKGQKLTPIDALKRFACFRLASRISSLRKAGYNIVSEIVTKQGKRFAQYSMP